MQHKSDLTRFVVSEDPVQAHQCNKEKQLHLEQPQLTDADSCWQRIQGCYTFFKDLCRNCGIWSDEMSTTKELTNTY